MLRRIVIYGRYCTRPVPTRTYSELGIHILRVREGATHQATLLTRLTLASFPSQLQYARRTATTFSHLDILRNLTATLTPAMTVEIRLECPYNRYHNNNNVT